MPDGMNVDYDGLIPNNVDLASDLRVRKALETWHPGYIDWWKDMGPEGFQESLVYLRTAISVDPKGWARFDYVRDAGIQVGRVARAPAVPGRTIGFGAHKGEPVWQEVPGRVPRHAASPIGHPGRHRARIRRAAAPSRQLPHPSLYDLRNLFQVNVEEGRHLWAMVYLLQKYFGKDGRDEAEDLLRRRSGNVDTPRMFGRLQRSHAGLAQLLHVHVLHRPRRQDAVGGARRNPASIRSAALAASCSPRKRIICSWARLASAAWSNEPARPCAQPASPTPNDIDAVRKLGVIDLPTIQRKMNLHFSLTLDLFGNEISTNAANAFNSGMKGRYREDKLADDHLLTADTYAVMRGRDGGIVEDQVPALVRR